MQRRGADRELERRRGRRRRARRRASDGGTGGCRYRRRPRRRGGGCDGASRAEPPANRQGPTYASTRGSSGTCASTSNFSPAELEIIAAAATGAPVRGGNVGCGRHSGRALLLAFPSRRRSGLRCICAGGRRRRLHRRCSRRYGRGRGCQQTGSARLGAALPLLTTATCGRFGGSSGGRRRLRRCPGTPSHRRYPLNLNLRAATSTAVGTPVNELLKLRQPCRALVRPRRVAAPAAQVQRARALGGAQSARGGVSLRGRGGGRVRKRRRGGK